MHHHHVRDVDFDLSAWRGRMGLTQLHAARILGCSVRTISGIEAGERPPSPMMIAACRWHEHERAPAPGADERLGALEAALEGVRRDIQQLIALRDMIQGS